MHCNLHSNVKKDISRFVLYLSGLWIILLCKSGLYSNACTYSVLVQTFLLNEMEEKKLFNFTEVRLCAFILTEAHRNNCNCGMRFSPFYCYFPGFGCGGVCWLYGSIRKEMRFPEALQPSPKFVKYFLLFEIKSHNFLCSWKKDSDVVDHKVYHVRRKLIQFSTLSVQYTLVYL